MNFLKLFLISQLFFLTAVVDAKTKTTRKPNASPLRCESAAKKVVQVIEEIANVDTSEMEEIYAKDSGAFESYTVKNKSSTYEVSIQLVRDSNACHIMHVKKVE